MSTTKTSPTHNPDLKVDGVRYELTAADVAEQCDVTVHWVRKHADALGGLKRAWGDAYKRPSSYRFPKKGIKAKVREHQKAMIDRKRGRG